MDLKNKTIIVTGASGFIGGQTVLALIDQGLRPIAIDNRPLPEHLMSQDFEFVQQDFAHPAMLQWIVSRAPQAIIHCAGTSLVGPSIQDPAEYYSNNVMKTMALINTIRASGLRTRIIYSSSAAVYGVPVMSPCQEVDLCDPISPYGESKRMVEQMLQSYQRAYGLDYVAFRYFNACGADPQGRHGQAPGATHIVAKALEAMKQEYDFFLFGDDYPTPDGTCIRDYVHVDDIARAHVKAIDTDIPGGIYNLGTNQGTSNRQILAAAQAVTGLECKVEVCASRLGDPPVLTACDDRFHAVAGSWRQYGLDDMIKHAWAWYNR